MRTALSAFVLCSLTFFSTTLPAYAQAPGGGGLLANFLPLILIFAIFWFLLIRPQQKRLKAHQAMVANLKKNDEVVTGGGLYGKVTKLVDEKTVELEIAKGTTVKVVRQTISEVVDTDKAPKSAASKSTPAKKKK